MIKPTQVGPLEVFREQVCKLWGIIQFDLRKPVAAATAETQLTAADATSAAFTVTMPPAAIGAGRPRAVYKSDTSANAVTVAPATGDAFGPPGNLVLSSPYDKALFISDGGTTWLRFVSFEGIQIRILFTRFDDNTMWAPIYHNRTTLTFNTDGSLTIVPTGANATGIDYMGGIRGRFFILPDATTKDIVLRVKMTNIAISSTSTAGDNLYGIIVSIPNSNAASALHFCIKTKWGGGTSEIESIHGKITDLATSAAQGSTAAIARGSVPTSVELKLKFHQDETAATKVLQLTKLEYAQNGGSFADHAAAHPTDNFYPVAKAAGFGLQIALAFYGRDINTDGPSSAKFTEFEVMEGIVIPV